MSVVVLVSGVAGLSGLKATPSPLPYWQGWDSTLEKGGITFARADLAPALSHKAAVAALAEQLPTLAPDGQPIHFVGHGRGGLVARAVVHEAGGRVRSVTCLGTPHRGLFAADVLVQAPTSALPGDVARRARALAGDDPDGSGPGTLAALDPRALERLNETLPNRPEVAYCDVVGRLDKATPGGLVEPVARLTELAGEPFPVPDGPLRRLRRWWQDHQVRIYGEACDLGLPGRDGPRDHDGVVAATAARNPWQRHPALPRWKTTHDVALLAWPLDHVQLAGIFDDRALRPAIRGWIKHFLKPADDDESWQP